MQLRCSLELQEIYESQGRKSKNAVLLRTSCIYRLYRNCASDFFSYLKCTIGLYYYVLVEVQAILAY